MDGIDFDSFQDFRKEVLEVPTVEVPSFLAECRHHPMQLIDVQSSTDRTSSMRGRHRSQLRLDLGELVRLLGEFLRLLGNVGFQFGVQPLNGG